PPVPTMSMAPAGAFTVSILPRMVATAPEISSTVSPRTRSAIRKPPIWLGVASPDIMMSKACRASSKVSSPPPATLAICDFRSAIAGCAAPCLLDGRAVDPHRVVALEPHVELVEQVVGHALREAAALVFRHGVGAGIDRLRRLGHAEDDLRRLVRPR